MTRAERRQSLRLSFETFIHHARLRVLNFATWVFLSRVRNSFVAKAFSGLSISALILSNIPDVLTSLGVTPWTVVSIYLGSIVFLCGYLLFYFYSPSEFKGHGEMVDHISRMQILSSQKFVSNRVELAETFIERVSNSGDIEMPAGILESLESTVDYFKQKSPQEQVAEAQRLFQDDLAAREHDSPKKRLRVAVLLAIGAFLIALPTVINVVVSLWSIIF